VYCQLHALDRDEYHHLEQVPCMIRSDDEPAVRVLSGILDSERMVNCVADVFVSDAVLAGRWVDLHENLVYYENWPLGERRPGQLSEMARPGLEPGTPRFSGTRRRAGRSPITPANRRF